MSLKELEMHEREARRLRAEYAGDLLVRLLVGIDLAIRRTAIRLRSLRSGTTRSARIYTFGR